MCLLIPVVSPKRVLAIEKETVVSVLADIPSKGLKHMEINR